MPAIHIVDDGIQMSAAVRKILHKTKRRHARGYQVGVMQAARIILAKAKDIVPYATGKLHDSGYTAKKGMGFRTVIKIGFREYYAIWVHEDTTKFHRAGTQAKFLTKAIEESKPQVRRLLLTSIGRG